MVTITVETAKVTDELVSLLSPPFPQPHQNFLCTRSHRELDAPPLNKNACPHFQHHIEAIENFSPQKKASSSIKRAGQGEMSLTV